MKEHGLLFKPEMVRAQLAGTKTQTRRPIARSNSLVDGYGASKELWAGLDFAEAWVDAGPSPAGNPGPYLKVPHADGTVHRVYPRVQVGDRIVCRETTREGCDEQSLSLVQYQADMQIRGQLAEDGGEGDRVGVTLPMPVNSHFIGPDKWRPSMLMHRWAARLVHDVTGSRPERLNDISEADAMAEGITAVPFYPDDGFPLSTGYMVGKDDGTSLLAPTAVEVYRKLWESINGAGSWLLNPWVWDYDWAQQ